MKTFRSKGKYNNKKVSTKDGLFDSQKEYKRWLVLKEMEKNNKIKNLQKQVKFVLIPSQRINGKVVERQCVYKADFVYYEGSEMVVEDVKSKATMTDVYKIKRKLMLKEYGIRIRETL